MFITAYLAQTLNTTKLVILSTVHMLVSVISNQMEMNQVTYILYEVASWLK